MTARSVTASSRLRYVHIAHRSGPSSGQRVPCRPPPPPAITRAMAIETSPGAEGIRRQLDELGVEFLFAQFVDMHGKPSAKLVPVQHLDALLTDGAGFAGFAAGDIGQGPHDPDIAAIPDPGSLTHLPWRPEVARFACDVTVEGEEWPFCPRTILRSQLARAAELGYAFKMGCELEYFLIRRLPGRRHRARRPARRPRPALLRHARPDPLARLRHRRRPPRQRARLGHLRHRPRGRERAVRAELPVRRRARLLRPGGVLPLHGRVARAGARADGHVHAQAVRAPDRQRLPHAHEPVGRRPPGVRARPVRGPARARPHARRATTSSAG